MGTKNNPGTFDAYNRALPDEPIFTLLARDPNFYKLIRKWASERYEDIICGDRPIDDLTLVHEAYSIADHGADWRKQNLGKWRNNK